MAKTPQTRDTKATKAALIESGARLFATQGFSGCRNQRIAEDAGVNKAMINYHFGGKLGLYRAVVTEAMEASMPLVETYRQEAETLAVPERLGLWIRALDTCFSKRPYLPGLLMREHLDGGARLQKEFKTKVSTFYLTTAWALKMSPQDGPTPHNVHLALIGALSFYLVTQPFRDEANRLGLTLAPDPERARYIDFLVRLYQGGLPQPEN